MFKYPRFYVLDPKPFCSARYRVPVTENPVLSRPGDSDIVYTSHTPQGLSRSVYSARSPNTLLLRAVSRTESPCEVVVITLRRSGPPQQVRDATRVVFVFTVTVAVDAAEPGVAVLQGAHLGPGISLLSAGRAGRTGKLLGWVGLKCRFGRKSFVKYSGLFMEDLRRHEYTKQQNTDT